MKMNRINHCFLNENIFLKNYGLIKFSKGNNYSSCIDNCEYSHHGNVLQWTALYRLYCMPPSQLNYQTSFITPSITSSEWKMSVETGDRLSRWKGGYWDVDNTPWHKTEPNESLVKHWYKVSQGKQGSEYSFHSVEQALILTGCIARTTL